MKYTVKAEINITAAQLADMFINNWYDTEQADFFNLLGKHYKNAEFNAELQCAFLAEHITDEGKEFIYTLANFLKGKKIPSSSPFVNTLINSY